MKSVPLRLLPFVVALPALASCAPSLSPIDVQAGCPEMPLRAPQEFATAPPDSVIDDFDDGDLKLTQIDGRTGSWVGAISPGPGGTGMFSGEPSNKCVARGNFSGHFTATGITDYAVNWNAGMVDPWGSATPYDAGAYSGFSFWIATGDSALAPLETPIGVITTDTAQNGGVCSVCGDYYAIRKRIPLTHTWTRHVVPFSDLAQYGFGVPQVPLNKHKIVSLIIWPEHQFDIWIDDVRFEP
jgi:hypothetical protein